MEINQKIRNHERTSSMRWSQQLEVLGVPLSETRDDEVSQWVEHDLISPTLSLNRTIDCCCSTNVAGSTVTTSLLFVPEALMGVWATALKIPSYLVGLTSVRKCGSRQTGITAQKCFLPRTIDHFLSCHNFRLEITSKKITVVSATRYLCMQSNRAEQFHVVADFFPLLHRRNPSYSPLISKISRI